MLKIVIIQQGGAVGLPVFISDTETKYFGKDVLRTPGVYEEVTGGKFELSLAQFQGQIGSYATSGMFLVFDPYPNGPQVEVQDVTEKLRQYLTVPETAAKMLLRQEDEEDQEFIENALATLKFYAGLTNNSKVFLPESACRYLPEEDAKKMRSTRKAYVLSNADNMEIVQANCTANFGVVLPDVEAIHSGDTTVSSLDILRVVAPCRRDVGNGIFQYNGIYHTPYYKVDSRLRGAVPSYLEFINGYTKNDTLEIQPNERHMYDNLYTLICSDTARYVSEIMTGLFFQTRFGQWLYRLIHCRNPEDVQELVAHAVENCPPGVKCSLTYTELRGVLDTEWNFETVSKLVKRSIEVMPEELNSILENLPADCLTVDTEYLPFVLDIDEDLAETFTSILIKRGVVSKAMLDYLLSLCKAAYEVNWGHTGAAMAISHFSYVADIPTMDKIISGYLGNALSKTPLDPSLNIKALYAKQAADNEVEEFESWEGSDDDDHIIADFNYYITSETARRIETNSLPDNFFTSGVTGAETTESSIVEYWRKVDGEKGLEYFLKGAFLTTGDIRVVLECFLKLMRWGSVKPAMLVLENYPDVKVVFDLNTGREVKNTAIVDESQLQLVNGCKYSLTGFLSAKDIMRIDGDTLVGFALTKDYGDVKTLTLASLVDVGEMSLSGEIDIAELKGVQTFDISSMIVDITNLASTRWDFYTSERNIKAGLQYNTKPASLSELSLLVTPGIMRSVDYLKSKQASVVITTRDRQYQILSAYAETLKVLASKYPEVNTFGKVTTMKVREWAELAYQTFDTAMTKKAPDANEARSSQAVRSMNLDLGGGSGNIIQFDDTPLEGKFTIVIDLEMQSIFPPIEFTDTAVSNLAKNSQVRNRIVMLLLVKDGKLIFCRKDIAANEVRLNNNNVSRYKYVTFVKAIDRLKKGQTTKVDWPGGERLTAVLHESLREFI